MVFHVRLDGNKQAKSKSNNISLSQSVGVTIPKKVKNASHSIEIVHDLERTYKPRYKSDYFSQDGMVRKPRYVADQNENHFVTLKVKFLI
jgi:NAD-dependent DNA ligase